MWVCLFVGMQHAKDRGYITATEWKTEWGGAKANVRVCASLSVYALQLKLLEDIDANFCALEEPVQAWL